jgi:hypothetical protein
MRNFLISSVLMLVSLTRLYIVGKGGLEGFLLAGAFFLSGVELCRQMEGAQRPLIQRMACIAAIILVALIHN